MTPAGPTPKISVIVPARNEERNLRDCLVALYGQNYPEMELIIVDDRSEDTTPQILSQFMQVTPIPMKAIRIEKLPEGWTGKNYAMVAGSKSASGEWLLFTDADTRHSPECLLTAVTVAEREKIDFLTMAPEVLSKTFWEKTVQPLAISSLALWFRSHEVNLPKSRITLANGQFLLIRRSLYEGIGGNEAVKSEVIEDVELAKRAKAAGAKVRFLNGTKLYSTRMYTTLEEIHTGWSRIYTHLFEKNLLAILHKIFLFLVNSCLPFFILIVESAIWITERPFFNPRLFLTAAAVSSLIVFARAAGNRLMRTSPWYAVYHLLGSIIMLWILATCFLRILFRRPSSWKGQAYH